VRAPKPIRQTLKRTGLQSGTLHNLCKKPFRNGTRLSRKEREEAFRLRLSDLKDPSGEFFALRRHLRRIKKTNEVGCWQVELIGAANQTPIPGRLCVVRKSQAAIAEARRKAKRSAQRDQRVLKTDTLHYAEYVMVFTTVGQEQFGPHAVLGIYRLRWQIELVFKRFKQLAHLGHLPKEDEESSKAWLYGKLFVALLTERLVRQAESLSPWGYEVAPPPELARV
jgi:Transposase DDE domain